MSIRLKEELRHSGVGLLLGLVGVLFGIVWAVYLTANHDSIHRRLEQAERASIEEKFVINSGAGEGHAGHVAPGDHAAHSGHASPEMASEGDHSAHAGHETASADSQVELVRKELAAIKEDIAKRATQSDHHGSPDMAKAHERLAKGHVHAMGLGVMSIVVSMLLAWLPASARAKTFAAACVGTGGIFYPLAWILMGMRTTAMGAAGAEASVLPMVGLSVVLVALGLFLTLVYALKWLLKG